MFVFWKFYDFFLSLIAVLKKLHHNRRLFPISTVCVGTIWLVSCIQSNQEWHVATACLASPKIQIHNSKPPNSLYNLYIFTVNNKVTIIPSLSEIYWHSFILCSEHKRAKAGNLKIIWCSFSTRNLLCFCCCWWWCWWCCTSSFSLHYSYSPERTFIVFPPSILI
jgi:hypothetical protein